MAFGFIKSTQNAGSSVTTLGITVPAVPLNTLVVVNVKFTSSGPTSVSVTDNASTPNTYAKAIGPITTTNVTMYQFYGVATVGGATIITVNWTNSATLRVTVDEFFGGQVTNAAVFDKAASNTGTGTSASLTLAPTNAGELVVAGIGINTGASAVVVGSNYIIGTNNASTTTEYRPSATTSETCPLSWTTSEAWADIAGAYIPLANYGNFAGII